MNYLIICLDSCRFDSFQRAQPPNFNKVGPLRKAYACAGHTAPAIFSWFMNLPQYNERRGKWLTDFPQPCWLPEELKRQGYFTAFITPNPWVFKYQWIFSRWFDVFEGLSFPSHASDKIIDRDIQIFHRPDKKFVFNLFLDTHIPYSHGGQVGAVQAVDKEFGRLLPHLKGTEVIVCADHGDLVSREKEGGLGHNPSMDGAFHHNLFEVPVIRGVIA